MRAFAVRHSDLARCPDLSLDVHHWREDGTCMHMCPRCGAVMVRPPALSRHDNVTSVCEPCGTLEALWQAQHPDERVPGFDVLLTAEEPQP